MSVTKYVCQLAKDLPPVMLLDSDKESRQNPIRILPWP